MSIENVWVSWIVLIYVSAKLLKYLNHLLIIAELWFWILNFENVLLCFFNALMGLYEVCTWFRSLNKVSLVIISEFVVFQFHFLFLSIFVVSLRNLTSTKRYFIWALILRDLYKSKCRILIISWWVLTLKSKYWSSEIISWWINWW